MHGKIYVVGIGPGSKDHLTQKAIEALRQSDVIIGYDTYIDLIEDLVAERIIIRSGMMKEVERCKEAVRQALEGKNVAVISSGDAGIYGMAGLVLELNKQLDVKIVPGITSAVSAASKLGAPLMTDFAVVSLSDLLVDWSLIAKRIEHAVLGDFVICIYNPKSNTRVKNIEEARDIIIRHRSGKTPVGIVKKCDREGEEVMISDLDHFLNYEIDMTTILIVGNSKTYVRDNRLITPRGYPV